MRFRLLWLMVAVAVIAGAFGAERLWRRRQFYLNQAAPHAQMEAFYTELALDIAGVWRQPPSETVDALLPDGSALQFRGNGLSRRVHYPQRNPNPADETTISRLVAMCRQEAAREGALRRVFERAASRPWLLSNPDPFPH